MHEWSLLNVHLTPYTESAVCIVVGSWQLLRALFELQKEKIAENDIVINGNNNNMDNLLPKYLPIVLPSARRPANAWKEFLIEFSFDHW